MGHHAQEPFGALLKHYRAAALLTQEQLAARAQLSSDTIRALERGRRHLPRPDSVRLLADALTLSGEDREAFLAAAVAPGAATSVDRWSTPNHAVLLGLAAPTPLVGRERELERIRQRLTGTVGEGNRSGERVRLLTLTGPAGVGKTRLALTAAGQLADTFPDGIVLVDLTPVRDPSLVVPTIARVLGLSELGTVPLQERLSNVLGEQRALLVLDNFEQVLPAAGALAALLAGCRELALLVTSRVPLRLRWERQLHVPPLAVPDLSASLPPPDVLARIPAVALFLERLRARRADFVLTAAQAPLVAQLVVELDGLPLALELAAARLGTLSLPTVVRRLADRLRLLRWAAPDAPERQQSLEAAVGWSYDLLNVQEQRLFRCLGVFFGRVTLDTIAAVAQAVAGPAGETDAAGGADAGRTLDGLLALAEHSLILPTRSAELDGWRGDDLDLESAEDDAEPAFGMLETVRAYAEEHLAAAGELTAARRAHAHSLLALAERADASLRGPEQRTWLFRLEHEHDNVRAALRWLLDQDDPVERERALRLAGALGYFWFVRGSYAEGSRWLEEALARTPGADAAVRTRALLGMARVLTAPPDLERARAALEEALALARQRDDRASIAQALARLGARAVFARDLTEGIRLGREALTHWEALGDAYGSGLALHLLGNIAFVQGHVADAVALQEDALQRFETAGDLRQAGTVRFNLTASVAQLSDLPRAVGYAQAGLEASFVLQDRWLLAIGAQAAVAVAGERIASSRRAQLLGAADALSQATGARFAWERLPSWASVVRLRERIEQADEGKEGVAYQKGRSLRLGEVATLALTLLQEVARAQSRLETAPAGARPTTRPPSQSACDHVP